MRCPYQQGWKQCRSARGLEIKAWQQVANLVKKMITHLLKKYKEDDDNNFLSPQNLISCIAFFTLIYSLTGIASMFYAK